MKSILISIKPEWVAKILNGDKTIEIRKTMPKCDLPIDVYIYCTKSKPNVTDIRDIDGKPYYCVMGEEYNPNLNGRVVAKFTLKKVELIYWGQDSYMRDECVLVTNSLDDYELEQRSCLKIDKLQDYIGYELENYGYAWHISDLVIFDKPRNLSDFKHPLPHCRLYCGDNFVPSFCRQYCSHNTDPERLNVWCDRYDKLGEPFDKAPHSWCYVEEPE